MNEDEIPLKLKRHTGVIKPSDCWPTQKGVIVAIEGIGRADLDASRIFENPCRELCIQRGIALDPTRRQGGFP